MAPSLDFTIALIPIAPFLAAVLAPWIHKFAGASAGWILALIPASIFIYLLGFVDFIAYGGFVEAFLPWVPAYNFDAGFFAGELNFSFFIDGLSLTFGLLISGIGTIILIYSGSYLRGHRHQGRFLAFILMFMGSMLGLVFANNLIVLFVFWELTSITSFLLIGFDHTRQASRRAAIQALVITGAGGLALLVGVLLLQNTLGAWDLSVINGRVAQGIFLSGAPEYIVIMVLFLAAAFTKSAQFPFHFWLPNAMEAPTPVSAFLHSATMVKAGVYLLARMNPTLGGTEVWTITLVVFGGVTLLYGATLALRQTDMKQMLAQTTVASLGLLVLLIGVGTDTAISAAVLYLIAHALYKAALFLIAGIIDHGTGTREITELGGMRGLMPVTFFVAILAALSMAGLPPAIGFLAKEEMYLGLISPQWWNILVLIVLVLGNALMLVVGASIAIKPFLGGLKPTPVKPHEAPFSMLIGPVLFGILALVLGTMPSYLGHTFMAPAASAIYNLEVESHLKLGWEVLLKPAFWLSCATWIIGAFLYWQVDNIRKLLRRFENAVRWNFDIGFDWLMFGLIRFASIVTRIWHNGRLELYMIVVFITLAIALYAPLLLIDGLPPMPEVPPLTFYEWGILLLASIGLISVVMAKSRLVAIVSLGIQGFAVALVFILFGAPDLAFTQLMVETLSVVILTLVMTYLHLEQRDSRVFEEVLRDGTLALVCGAGVTLLLVTILQYPFDPRLSEFFAQTSVPIAHGRNVVNVILVDYRGLDTFGEIAVVMTAGIAVLALIRIRAGASKKTVTRKRTSKPRQRKGATA